MPNLTATNINVVHVPLSICISLTSQDENQLEVAVKVFDQSEMGFMSLGHQEVTRSYSDMRYELNKLCTLSHAYIVRFVGLFTNPHCFVLEWAPLQSLEHLRARQKQAKIGMCFFSILKILCQVSWSIYVRSSRVFLILVYCSRGFNSCFSESVSLLDHEDCCL